MLPIINKQQYLENEIQFKDLKIELNKSDKNNN